MMTIHPGGVLRMSGDRDDGRLFLCLNFRFPDFWVGKFGKYLSGGLDKSRELLRFSKQSEDSW